MDSGHMASSSQAPRRSRAAPSRGRGPARRSNDWSWWSEVNAQRPAAAGGGARQWSCKYCSYSRAGGANKVRAHFLCEPGQQVQFCTGLSEEKKRFLQEKAIEQDSIASQRRLARPVAVDPHAFVSPAVGGSTSGTHATSCGTGQSMTDIPTSSADPMRARQTRIDAHFDAQKKEDADMAVARFFYHDHIAFYAARSEYFKIMCKKIGEYGPSYVPPSCETIRTTLLEKERVAVERAAENKRRLWKKNGVSLIVDGWSDTRKRSIHGMVAYSRGEMYFLSSHDASGTGKSASVLSGEWIDGVEMIGADVVVGFVCDGEAANRAAGDIVEAHYPHVTVSYCMAHCLNNLLKDIGRLPWIQPIIENANHMVTFVLNHQFLRYEFSKKSRKILLKYSDTRFAYNFLMLGRLSTCSSALRQVFISDEFRNNALSATQSGQKCLTDSENGAFWDEVRRIDAMVQPIIHLLRLVDSMQPCIGKVYEAMDKMIEDLVAHFPMETSDATLNAENEEKYIELKSLCVVRWEKYYSPLHAAAYVLDPEFQGKGQEGDKEVNKGWQVILNRLVPNGDDGRKVRDSLSEYRSFRGMYGSADAQEDRLRVGGALWWEDYGSDGPELQQLAIRILSQAVSSSCLEQLWSSYSHIASKKRNSLGVQKASDLVFVSANLRMLGKNINALADSFVVWEQQQEEEQQLLRTQMADMEYVLEPMTDHAEDDTELADSLDD